MGLDWIGLDWDGIVCKEIKQKKEQKQGTA
jgi:hypothetical protein